MFFRQATALGERPLFHVKRQGRYEPLTWRTAAAEVEALAQWLITEGVQAGERVLILSENRPEWGIADLAIQAVGAWSVPLYPNLTAEGVRAISLDCAPVAAIGSTAEQLQKLQAAGCPSLRRLVTMEPTVSHAAIPWTQALEQGRTRGTRAALSQRLQALQPEHTATLIYTSGTTGEPKGVMLSHRNFLSNVAASLEVMPINHTDTHLSFLPLCHVFERMAGWYLMLQVGAQIAYAESMDTIPENMMEVHPTIMLGVPRFFEKLYTRIREGIQHAPPLKQRLAYWAIGIGKQAAAYRQAGQALPAGLALQQALARRLVLHKLQARLGGRLRFFVSGSAPLAKEIGEFFDSVEVAILEGYGLTETSPVIAVNRLPVPRFGTVGPLLPGVEVRIAEDGEILTRGPHVMQGYYHKPEATAAVIVEGWFHTGDIGHLDACDCLVITDRKKDLIKTAGGKFVAPQKLENLLITDPWISQVFVYGDRRPYCVALIVPHAAALREASAACGLGATGAPAAWVKDPRVIDQFWQRVQARQATLAGYEQLKRIALLDQEFSLASGELTPTLKAKRSVIAQRYAAILDSLYAA